MNDIKTLREFERRLVPTRAIANANANLEQFIATLPDHLEASAAGMLAQGFDAGWAAAMNEIRALLLGMQNEALRAMPADASKEVAA